MKKISLIIICLITAFTFTIGFTSQPYSVSASTILNQNLFDYEARPLSYSTGEATFLETGFIVAVKETSLNISNSSSIVLAYSLIPNTEYILTYSVEKLVGGSHNRVLARNSNGAVIKQVIEGDTLTFITDATGTGRFEFYAYYDSVNKIDKVYKTKYFDINLWFTDENLGNAYLSGYNNGLSKRDVREWRPFTDIEPLIPFWDFYFMSEKRLYDIHRIVNTMPWHLGSGVSPFGYTRLGLPAGTYRISYIGGDSLWYPLAFDFEGLIYRNVTFNFIGPICEPGYHNSEYYDTRAEMVSLEVLNLDNTLYTFEDACARKPFVFTVPQSLYHPDENYAYINFYIMKLDSSFNFVAWDIDPQPDFFDYWSIDILEPTSTYNQGYADGYDIGFHDGDSSGYDRGYENGYTAGYNLGSSSSITTNWFISFLDSVFGILNIEVFPNIKLAYLIFIPVGLGVLALIFKLVRG